jgi:hypothetical protein
VTAAGRGRGKQRGVGEAADEPTTQPIGFVLRRLLLLGTHANPATLEFERGLNVITGSSDTGKSFALECLDFMLGAKSRPREIDEARPYEKVALEIESASGEILTLERALDGGQVKCYKAAYADITAETPFELLAAKHSAATDKTLSFRLLALCDLAGRMLRKNARNDTRPVSIRNVAKLVLVDEQRVISRDSPAMGDVTTDATADKSLLALLLTGRDDTGLVSLGDVTDRKARLIAQADLLEGLLASVSTAASPAPSGRVDLVQRREALQAHIQEITQRVTEGGRAVDEARAESAAVMDDVVAGRSRLIVVGELLSRFTLLRRSYESDLQRLEFIAEGHHYFSQLSAVVCPTCSQPLLGDSTTHSFCEQGGPLADDVQTASAREAEKIRVHLRDLETAAGALDEERSALRERIRGGTERYGLLEQLVQRELQPRLGDAAKELKDAMELRHQVIQEEAALDHRTGLLEKKLEIERILQELMAVAEAPDRGEVPYQAFASIVGTLLHAWGFPGECRVTFDERKMDIVVDGGARELHGKGVRAIMYAAFVIGLMRYCRSRRLPHPGFVVLDSPLTTYRRRGESKSGESDPMGAAQAEEAPEDMQRSFFEHLARSSAELGEQIVLFENKEPQASIIPRIHYVQFTGLAGIGRAGFIPTEQT